MIVCICNRLNEREIDAAIQSGARTVTQVFAHHGTKSNCGRCGDCICDRLDDAANDAVWTPLAAE